MFENVLIKPKLNVLSFLCCVKCSCGSVVKHCVSSAKVVGSIPREHMYWQYKCIACKSLWIKATAKCINVKRNVLLNSYMNQCLL